MLLWLTLQGLRAISISKHLPLRLKIGDLGFVSVPYEMFDTNGVKFRNDSPFEMTFILTNAWGDFAYMPSYEAWTIYGGYETTATYFDVGVAEKLIEELVGMLKSHKK